MPFQEAKGNAAIPDQGQVEDPWNHRVAWDLGKDPPEENLCCLVNNENDQA